MELPERVEEEEQVAVVRPKDDWTSGVKAELHLVTLSTCIRDVAARSWSRSSSLTLLPLEAPPTRFRLRQRKTVEK